MKIWLGFLFLFCISIPVIARLGETESQCTHRYGDELTVTNDGTDRSVEYIKDGYVIVVTFLNGSSVCEVYKKNGGAPLTDAEVMEIIAKNGGEKWQIVQDNQPSKHWAPSDESVEAGASFQSDTLVVWAPGARMALARLKEFSQKQNQIEAQTKAQQATSGL